MDVANAEVRGSGVGSSIGQGRAEKSGDKNANIAKMAVGATRKVPAADSSPTNAATTTAMHHRPTTPSVKQVSLKRSSLNKDNSFRATRAEQHAKDYETLGEEFKFGQMPLVDFVPFKSAASNPVADITMN